MESVTLSLIQSPYFDRTARYYQPAETPLDSDQVLLETVTVIRAGTVGRGPHDGGEALYRDSDGREYRLRVLLRGGVGRYAWEWTGPWSHDPDDTFMGVTPLPNAPAV